MFAFQFRFVFDCLKLLDSQKPNRVRVDVVTLDFVGEMAGVDKLGTRSWSAMVFIVELADPWDFFTVRYVHRVTEHPEVSSSRSVVDDRLSVFIVSDTPRVGDVCLHHAFDFP